MASFPSKINMHSIYLLNRQNPSETHGYNRADSVAAYLLGRRLSNYVIIVIKDDKPVLVDIPNIGGLEIVNVLEIQNRIAAVLYTP